MDFAIQIATDGSGFMTFTPATNGNIANNVWLSLETPRGSCFWNSSFGSRLGTLRRSKNTPSAPGLVADYVAEALQWMIDAGRITKVKTVVQPSLQDPTRLNALIAVTQANGEVITFETFVGVV